MIGLARRAYAVALYGPGTSLWTTPEYPEPCLLALPDGRCFIGRSWRQCFFHADAYVERIGGFAALKARAEAPLPSIEEAAEQVMALVRRLS